MIIYSIAISIFAFIITCYDKIAAKRLPRNRVSEKALILTALFGGAAAMYVAMKIIRHKTRHPKFMVGLPIIIILQIAIFLYIHI